MQGAKIEANNRPTEAATPTLTASSCAGHCVLEFVEVVLIQVGVEVANPVDHLDGAQIFLRALCVDIARGLKSAHLEVAEGNAPRLLLDQLTTAPAPRSAAGGSLGSFDPGQSLVGDPELGDRPQTVAIDQLGLRCFQDLEQDLRALERGAKHVKPDRHLAIAKGVGFALTEPRLPLGDGPLTAAALGTAAQGGFEHVSHVESVPGRVNQSDTLYIRTQAGDGSLRADPGSHESPAGWR